MKQTFIVLSLLLFTIKVNSSFAGLNTNTAGVNTVTKTLGTQVENHESNVKEEPSDAKKNFVTYIDKIQKILKIQYHKLMVFQNPLNTFFKKISLFGIQDFTPYIILALAVVLGLFHMIRDFESYSGIKLFIYTLLFIITAFIQILYVYAYANEGIWVLDHNNVGWFFSALSFLISIFVIYVQMACFDDILNDLGAYTGIDIRYKPWYITGIVVFGIGIAGFYFFSKLLVLSFFIFISSVLVCVLIIIRKSLKIRSWKYGLFISLIYIIGTVSCLVLCIKFLNEYSITLCVIGTLFLLGGNSDGSKSSTSDKTPQPATTWSPPSTNDDYTPYHNPYAHGAYYANDDYGNSIELTKTGSNTYIDNDHNTYTESPCGTITRDSSYSDDD